MIIIQDISNEVNYYIMLEKFEKYKNEILA